MRFSLFGGNFAVNNDKTKKMSKYQLTDNSEKRQYEFAVEGFTPRIEYIKTAEGEIYLTHTEVPAELGGRGIASALAKQTMQDIDKQGLKLVPVCPFIATYIDKHPEWKKLIFRGVKFQ